MTYIPQDLPESGSTVVVGMSGGVDSTLTAILLQERGCKVIGVTMSLWDGHELNEQEQIAFSQACYGPNQKKNIEECRKFCENRNIEYHVIDLSREYSKAVLDYFKSEYRSGHTPNPCIQCNRLVKFGALLEGVQKLGIDFDYFCTGHYAKIVRPQDGVWGTSKRPFMISCASDTSKDQTYFLYRVPSEVLEKVRFPLASLKKSEVYELARKAELAAADRKESQDFLNSRYFDSLFTDKPSVPGDFVDQNGKLLGRHKGIEHYTIGQRRGLGVSAANPLYVQKIDATKNQIVLTEKALLGSTCLVADDFVWPGDAEPDKSFEALVKIRLRSPNAIAKIEKYEIPEGCEQSFKGQPWKFTFSEEQYAVTPGQSVVIYKDDVIVGGGIIVNAL